MEAVKFMFVVYAQSEEDLSNFRFEKVKQKPRRTFH